MCRRIQVCVSSGKQMQHMTLNHSQLCSFSFRLYICKNSKVLSPTRGSLCVHTVETPAFLGSSQQTPPLTCCQPTVNHLGTMPLTCALLPACWVVMTVINFRAALHVCVLWRPATFPERRPLGLVIEYVIWNDYSKNPFLGRLVGRPRLQLGESMTTVWNRASDRSDWNQVFNC